MFAQGVTKTPNHPVLHLTAPPGRQITFFNNMQLEAEW